MKRYLPVVILTCTLGFAADPPEQAKRGEALFALKSASGYSCTTCHQVGGQGTAVGPDLKTIARLHPRAVVMAILATRTQAVVEVTPLKSKSFPAMKAGPDEYFDLSVNPPAKRTLTAAEIRKTQDNGDWKHPPESRGLTRDQLADLIAYIRFATFGDTKGVDPADIPSR
jgi:hypothetical protein